DADDVERERRMPVDGRRRAREREERILHANRRKTARVDPVRCEDRDGATRRGFLHEDRRIFSDDEEIARLDAARVVVHAADLHLIVSLDARSFELSRDVGELDRMRRANVHDGVSSERTIALPFGASPFSDWRTTFPLPTTRTTKPAFESVFKASRAGIPVTSGIFAGGPFPAGASNGTSSAFGRIVARTVRAGSSSLAIGCFGRAVGGTPR